MIRLFDFEACLDCCLVRFLHELLKGVRIIMFLKQLQSIFIPWVISVAFHIFFDVGEEESQSYRFASNGRLACVWRNMANRNQKVCPSAPSRRGEGYVRHYPPCSSPTHANFPFLSHCCQPSGFRDFVYLKLSLNQMLSFRNLVLFQLLKFCAIGRTACWWNCVFRSCALNQY